VQKRDDEERGRAKKRKGRGPIKFKAFFLKIIFKWTLVRENPDIFLRLKNRMWGTKSKEASLPKTSLKSCQDLMEETAVVIRKMF
jgi:hypothetical protein